MSIENKMKVSDAQVFYNEVKKVYLEKEDEIAPEIKFGFTHTIARLRGEVELIRKNETKKEHLEVIEKTDEDNLKMGEGVNKKDINAFLEIAKEIYFANEKSFSRKDKFETVKQIATLRNEKNNDNREIKSV